MSQQTPHESPLIVMDPAMSAAVHDMTADMHAGWAARALTQLPKAENAWFVGTDAYSTAAAARIAAKDPAQRTPEETGYLQSYHDFQTEGLGHNASLLDAEDPARALSDLAGTLQNEETAHQVRVAVNRTGGDYEDMEKRVVNALHVQAAQDDIDRSYDQARAEYGAWRDSRHPVRKAIGSVATSLARSSVVPSTVRKSKTLSRLR